MLLALSAALVLAALQDPQEPPLPWNGLDGFVMLLGKCGVQLRTDSDLKEMKESSSTLVIMMGEAPRSADLNNLIAAARKWGAKLLVASDRPSMSAWFRLKKLDFVPGPVLVEDGRRDGFNEATDCPLIRGASSHPFFENVGRIALNRAAGFRGKRALSYLPRDVEGRTLGWIWSEDAWTVLISDHSLFINLMLTELDNARFAENLIRWFGVTDAILVSDGELIRYEKFPWSSSQAPDARTALAMAGPALRSLEKSGMLQDFAEKNAALAIGMATIILGAIGALGVIRARSRPVAALETTGPLLPDMSTDPGAPTNRPDYHIAARELLQRWWRHGRKTRDLPSIEAFAEGRFSFEPGTPILKRWIWRYQLKRIARLTLRPPRRIHLAGYQGLAAALGRLDALGRIR